MQRRPGKRSPELSDAQKLAGTASGSSEPQPTRRTRGARYPISRWDSDDFTDDYSEREEEDDTPSQTPTTDSASDMALQKNASSDTITRASFSSVSNNDKEASYANPPSLDFANQAYHSDSPNPHPLKRRTTLDHLVFAIDDGSSHSTQSNSSVASLPGRGNAWNDVGAYMGASDPSPSRRVTMGWGALPDSVSAYGRSSSRMQEVQSVHSNAGFSDAVIGRDTATVVQNPTYGPMPPSSMFPCQLQTFGSYTGGNGVPFDSPSWTDNTPQFQFQVGVEREFTEQRQPAASQHSAMRIEMIDEGSIPAAPTPRHRGSVVPAHPAGLRIPNVHSPDPASSPALSIASSSCGAGSGSIAPSMLSLSPPPPPPCSSPFGGVTGATHERSNNHARNNASPAAGAVVGSQRMRRNALSTTSARPPRPSTVAPPPVPAIYHPLGPSPDSCSQSRPSPLASSETLQSIPRASSFSLVGPPGPTSETYLLPPAGGEPPAAPHYFHEMMNLNPCASATTSASRTDPASYDPPLPPRQHQQSQFDAQQYPPTY